MATFYDAVQSGRKGSLDRDALQQRNALAALDVQMGQRVNALASDPNATPDQFARAGRSDIGNALINSENSRAAANAQKVAEARQWFENAVEHIRRDPNLIPRFVQQGKKMGFLDPNSPDTVPPEQVEALALQMGIAPAAQFQGSVEQQRADYESGLRTEQEKRRQAFEREKAALEHRYRMGERETKADNSPLFQIAGPNGQPIFVTREEAVGKPAYSATAASNSAKASSTTAWDMYSEGTKGLMSALGDATTGPFAGRLPAFFDEGQTAEGAVSAMAPILKQMFRAAGEGTFTDKDQELLLKMVPARVDRPLARVNKMKNIDNIVRAKLGIAKDAPGPLDLFSAEPEAATPNPEAKSNGWSIRPVNSGG